MAQLLGAPAGPLLWQHPSSARCPAEGLGVPIDLINLLVMH